MEVGSFYVVATPIGNLKDITLRAIEVLKSVDYIACEDTRVTRKLLDKYEIKGRLFDYHKFNEKECSQKIIKLLEDGKSVALVSDAGTPGISDPGRILFEELYNLGFKVVPIPGASAVSAFLSVLPRGDEHFEFAGFAPKGKKQQEDFFSQASKGAFIFYDSPNRLLETLNNIQSVLGANRKIAVGRELTKVFEEVKIATVAEMIEYYSSNVLKGELVVMIYPSQEAQVNDEDLRKKIAKLKSEGYSDKDISKILSVLFEINKNRVYKLSLELS